MKKTLNMLFVIITLSCSSVWAGKAETMTPEKFLDVINDLTDKYNSLKGYSVNVFYRSYPNYETTALEEESFGFINRSGFDYSSYVGNVLVIRNERAMLTVDSIEQKIIISDPKPDLAPEMMEFKSNWVTNSARSITTKFVDGLKSYRVDFKDGFSIKSYEFVLNSIGLLYKISIFYDIKREEGFGEEVKMVNYLPRLEITFGEYNINPTFRKDEFSEKRILKTADSKKYFLPAGSSFQLYDQRIVKPD